VSFRMCAHNNELCECNDTAMQPCLAALIESYLEELRFYVLTGEDHFLISFRRDDINNICRSFPTWAALKTWVEGPDTP
jgi:hypothetical protein